MVLIEVKPREFRGLCPPHTKPCPSPHSSIRTKQKLLLSPTSPVSGMGVPANNHEADAPSGLCETVESMGFPTVVARSSQSYVEAAFNKTHAAACACTSGCAHTRNCCCW